MCLVLGASHISLVFNYFHAGCVAVVPIYLLWLSPPFRRACPAPLSPAERVRPVTHCFESMNAWYFESQQYRKSRGVSWTNQIVNKQTDKLALILDLFNINYLTCSQKNLEVFVILTFFFNYFKNNVCVGKRKRMNAISHPRVEFYFYAVEMFFTFKTVSIEGTIKYLKILPVASVFEYHIRVV